MSTQEILQQAEQLFQEGKYSEAVDLGKQIDDNEDVEIQGKILLISTKCLLQLISVDDEAELKSLFGCMRTLLKNAGETGSVEKFYDVANQCRYAWELWENRLVNTFLDNCHEKPLKLYGDLMELRQKTVNAWYPMEMLIAIWRKQLAKEQNTTWDVLEEKYGSGRQMLPPGQDFDSILYEKARHLEQLTNGTLQETNAMQTVEELKAVYEWMNPAYTAIASMYKFSGSSSATQNKQTKIKRLQSSARLLHYILNDANVFVNGKATSLYYTEEQRAKQIAELKSVYAEIQKIDPNFVMPALPSQVPPLPYTKSGCYVATAVYGSYDCPQVWTLRRFRDDTLAKSWYGRAFIRTYYAISPTLVKWFGQTAWFQKLWRGKLDKMVKNLQANGVESTPYQDKNW